ncbi:MAG: ScpA family protein [Bdellovibrionales bacterium]
MSIHVQLERFEGPLGLLLHLIREQEMDIFNINIHQITRQYLEYIKAMRRLDLEVAGEFVAMAATLLHIKSRMLLPQYTEDGEPTEDEDPRKELVQKLLEYQKVKELSAELYKRPLLGRDVFPRAEKLELEALQEGELILEEKPLFALIAAYRSALKNMKKTVHKVASELQSIASRILELKDRLIVGKRIVFTELITEGGSTAGTKSNQVLVTFLSLLELAKMGFISVFQSEPFSDIHIEPKKVIDRDVVSRVESYDSVNAEAMADKIMVEAQLTLDEPVVELEGEGEVVVQESFADAASDDEIFAEEARIAAEEAAAANTGVGDPVGEAIVAGMDAAPAASDAGLESDTNSDTIWASDAAVSVAPDTPHILNAEEPTIARPEAAGSDATEDRPPEVEA